MFRTSILLEIDRMILHFFPTMRLLAFITQCTSLFIIHQKTLLLPIGTLFSRILHDGWIPSKVLPIVTIDTVGLVMFKLIEWTENSLKPKDVEVSVINKTVDHGH